MSIKPSIIAPTLIPNDVYKLNQKLKIAFQRKIVNYDLLRQFGRALWDCSNLNVDITLNIVMIEKYQELAWECLYHPQAYFIAQHTPIIRRTVAIQNPSHFNYPLRILHFTSEASQTHYLNLAEEQYFLYQALRSPIQNQQVLLNSTRYGNFAQFKILLQQYWDIVILSAHSIDNKIVFESEIMSYQSIIQAFSDANVQCVVLATCESAELAYKLQQLGIPCVVGMQFNILDRAASLFISQLCQAVIEGNTLFQAVQIARCTMQNLLKPNEQWQENETGQWFIPCFYAQLETPRFLIKKPVSIQNHTYSVKLLIGRRKLFYELEKLLLANKKIWLYGVGGIGKTALAQALQQHFIALHKPIYYVEMPNNLPSELPVLAVSRHKPPPGWIGFELPAPTETEFVRYAQYQGLAYPDLQLRLIYKMLQGNYQGLQLLQSLPFTTQANILRQQLCVIQRYLKAYKR